MYSLPDESAEELIRVYYHPVFAGVHPAADLLPLPGAEDFDRLCESIMERGLGTPLKRDKVTRLLLDGRSRLLACYVTGLDPRVEDVSPASPTGYSMEMNLARRHLTASQRAAVAASALELYETEAKERQRAAGILGNVNRHKSPVEVNSPHPGEETPKVRRRSTGNTPSAEVNSPQPIDEERAPQARDKAAADFGVSGQSVSRAKVVREHDPAAFEKVKAGDVTINAAYQVAKEKKAAKQSAGVGMTTVITTDGRTAPIQKPKLPVFNKTNDSVSWAGYTWNPVTGCEHGCPFCYAREIALSERMKPHYPLGFTPVFHEHRLSAPVNTKPDGAVFVCSMADLFGKWVPDEWIQKVFDACMAAPDWEYMFLTKWPKRYQLLAGLPKAAFGASIIRQVDVKRVERDMAAFDTTGKKWISMEPMLEPIEFSDLSWCDMVVIGGQTSTRQPEGFVPEFAPDFDWVFDVVAQCIDAGVPYYLKPNLLTKPGMVLPQPNIWSPGA